MPALLAAGTACTLAVGLAAGYGRTAEPRFAAELLAAARHEPLALAELLRAHHPERAQRFAAASADPALQVRLLELFAPGAERAPFTAALAARLPHRASLRSLQAEDAWRQGDRAAALAHARAAVALAPTHLPYRRQLIDLLRRDPADAAAAAAAQAELERLQPLVHRADR